MRDMAGVLVVALALPGCLDTTYIEVHLRDVRDVAVQEDRRTGTKVILPAGADGRSVPIAARPRSLVASVTRVGSSPLRLECSVRVDDGEGPATEGCSPDHRDLGTTLQVAGGPAEVLGWTPTSLYISYPYWRHAGRHNDWAYSVDLVTPRANILEVRRVVIHLNGKRESQSVVPP